MILEKYLLSPFEGSCPANNLATSLLVSDKKHSIHSTKEGGARKGIQPKKPYKNRQQNLVQSNNSTWVFMGNPEDYHASLYDDDNLYTAKP